MADTTSPSASRTEPPPEKVAAVAELSAAFRDSTAALLTEYRGLTMAELTELRRALGTSTTYAVVKNTLTKRAAADAGLDLDDGLFTGPTAIAFVGGDPVEAAKGVRDFSRSHPRLVIKGAMLEGAFLSADEVRRLADLESREVLLGRLAGAMLASLSQAASLFQAPLSAMARVAAALRDQMAQAADAPAAASPAGDVPAADSPDSPDSPSADNAAPEITPPASPNAGDPVADSPAAGETPDS